MEKLNVGLTYLLLITACSEQKSVDSIEVSNGAAEPLVTGLLNQTIIHDGGIREHLSICLRLMMEALHYQW